MFTWLWKQNGSWQDTPVECIVWRASLLVIHSFVASINKWENFLNEPSFFAVKRVFMLVLYARHIGFYRMNLRDDIDIDSRHVPSYSTQLKFSIKTRSWTFE